MIIHVVVPGDTLQLLARTYSASVQRIISDNGLMYPYRLTVGQALIITQPTLLHTVKAGESPFSIAISYGISVQELYQNNPELTYGVTLYPGQVLTIAFWGSKDRSIAVKGYAYPHIDQTILRRAMPFLTYLSIFSYGFRANGSLIPIDDAYLLNQAKLFQALPIMVLTSLDEGGNFSSELTEQLLLNTDMQNMLLGHIVDTLLVKGYRGLEVDFEFVPGELAEAYVAFLENAKSHLSPHGLLLHTDLAPKTSDAQPGRLYEGHDYRRIGQVVDLAMLMTYEWGYTFGPPMAVAPINQVEKVVQYAVDNITPDKLLLGIPNYGYDWELPFVKGLSQAISISNQYAVHLAVENGIPIQYDPVAQSPFFRYTDGDVEHEVWFEDVRSIQAKYNLLDSQNLFGSGYWTVMRPFAQNWAFLSTQYHIKKLM